VLNVVGWTFALYAALKLCHLVLGHSKEPSGAPIAYSTRVRAGEPALLIGTVAVVALLLLYTSWWSHRFHAGHYARASACYPKLAAARYLPQPPARFGTYEASVEVTELRGFAEEHGAALGLDPSDVDRTLETSRTAHVRRYSALARSHDRPLIAAAVAELDHCLRGDSAPRGEILNPD
jgi:hypothetical protein